MATTTYINGFYRWMVKHSNLIRILKNHIKEITFKPTIEGHFGKHYLRFYISYTFENGFLISEWVPEKFNLGSESNIDYIDFSGGMTNGPHDYSDFLSFHLSGYNYNQKISSFCCDRSKEHCVLREQTCYETMSFLLEDMCQQYDIKMNLIDWGIFSYNYNGAIKNPD